ncbi:DUF3450 family protein [Pelagicoccus sp. SDUM812003]|uniref:DUF3450 family protein n=1 Tax=Pelagicoccus sp. SDUM812003 TaxID=3041267 RepID=UPI00280D549B|nr:DUF3450 family protein [Pelagicoccus sp. SDUM812003]MDQ8204769.1 DUF3450 family protein [Pelagicoccus sp. SDUM812003]
MPRPKTILLLGFTFASWAASAMIGSTEDSPLQQLKRYPSESIEVRIREVEARQRWRTEKEVLQHSISVMRETLDELQRQIEQSRERAQAASASEEKTKSALDDKESGNRLLASRIDLLEARTRELARFAPPPLRKQIEPQLLRLGGTGEDDSLAIRIQSITTILTRFDQFNKQITDTRTIRKTDAGEARETRILYWGLAQGYAISSNGSEAWLLTPALDDWKWLELTTERDSVARLFETYDKDLMPQFVSAPARQSKEEPAR